MISNNVSFKGIPIAKARVMDKNITLYKLTEKDREFADALTDKLNLKELMSGLSELDYKVWKDITNRGLLESFRRGCTSILATIDKKPCGVLNHIEPRNKCVVNFISTWPIEKNKKPPFVCKTLLSNLFTKILKTDCNFVELLAVKYGPFSAISKYMQMGFRSVGGDNFFENMSINRERMTKALSQTKELIKLEPITNAPEEDLLKTLKLPE